MILIHRCTKCGDTDLGHLRKGCRTHSFGPPEIAPSFTDSGRRIERLAPPGTTLATMGTARTCSCEDCHTAYADAVSDHAQSETANAHPHPNH